jgi:hypothetical protein
LKVRANLTEYGLPVERRAEVRAELLLPDNTSTVLALTEVEPGVFEASTVASMQGIYRFRIMASGVTLRGMPFTREQTLTGAVFQGGDKPLPTSRDDPRTRDEQLCHLLECIIASDAFSKFFSQNGVNVEALAKCIRQFCKERLEQQERPAEGRTSAQPNVPATMDINEIRQLLAQPGVLENLIKIIGIMRKPGYT